MKIYCYNQTFIQFIDVDIDICIYRPALGRRKCIFVGDIANYKTNQIQKGQVPFGSLRSITLFQLCLEYAGSTAVYAKYKIAVV